MATSSKKGAKKSKPKPRPGSAADTVSKLKETIAAQAREIREGAERESATSDILRMIARAPTDLQAVLDSIAERAAKLCDAADAVVWRVDGDVFRAAAHFGPIPMVAALGERRDIYRGTINGRAVIDRQTIHVGDLAAAETEFPLEKTRGIAVGLRTVLATPMLRDGVATGLIAIRRQEVRPFSDRQIKLLETFADQAVIAIENARLFQGLTEALEQQTATSEILRVISQSPTDLQAVLDAVATNAARLCDAEDVSILEEDQGVFRVAAFRGARLLKDFEGTPVGRGSVAGRAIVDRQTIHIHDIADESEAEFSVSKAILEQSGHRTMLASPLFREGLPIGAIFISRPEARPFSYKQIALLKTFADQAVIAIENVRLFKELQERKDRKSTRLNSSH